VDTSKASTQQKKKDLEFIKSQLTMTEVTISRFYNYGVMRKKQVREEEEEE
jgi:hypothetical protein